MPFNGHYLVLFHHINENRCTHACYAPELTLLQAIANETPAKAYFFEWDGTQYTYTDWYTTTRPAVDINAQLLDNSLPELVFIKEIFEQASNRLPLSTSRHLLKQAANDALINWITTFESRIVTPARIQDDVTTVWPDDTDRFPMELAKAIVGTEEAPF